MFGKFREGIIYHSDWSEAEGKIKDFSDFSKILYYATFSMSFQILFNLNQGISLFLS